MSTKNPLFPVLFLAFVAVSALCAGGESSAQTNTLRQLPGDALSNLDRAMNAHRVGDNMTALESIWAAQEVIWNQSPLGVRNAVFVTESPVDYGAYRPKEGEDFKPSELIILYCEPFGYTQRKNPDNTYSFSYTWSFQIFDAQNNFLGGQNDIGPIVYDGYRSFKTENMLAATINVSNIPAGSYSLQITIKDDLNPAHSVDIRKPFNIVPEAEE